MKESIFHFIQSHLDENGFFTAPTLPDENPYGRIWQHGNADAYYYTAEKSDNIEDGSKLLRLLRAYLTEPIQVRRQALYTNLNDMSMAEYCDFFVSGFDQDEMNGSCFDLARRFFYNSLHREPLKFAMLLFGIYGMQKIHDYDPELWRDILTAAHCEEFTFSFFYACHLTNYSNQKAVWELLGCTKGWGKIFAIIDCQCPDDDHRLWLLKSINDVITDYLPISVKLIQVTRLDKFLQQTVIDLTCYQNALQIIGSLLILLLHSKPSDIREHYNLSEINIYDMLKNLLRHAEYLPLATADLLDISALATAMRRLLEKHSFYLLTPNQLQELIAACDAQLYVTDWHAVLEKHLVKDEQINYPLIDLAFEIEIDLWQKVYDLWLRRPEEYKLLPYLFIFCDDEQHAAALKQLTKIMPLYAANKEALLTALNYLNLPQGEGEAIFCAALTSIYEDVRIMVCEQLGGWDKEALTPAIKAALKQAYSTSADEIAKEYIHCLLAGTKPDMNYIHSLLHKRKA